MGIPFAESENQSAKRLVGLGLVLFLHLVIAYILVTSLTTDFTKPVEKPVELQIIQDIEPPPP
ncbi:MAG TPA: energy transducer TonB, partial [Acinetobacter junii]|nr:energy transducer TonB [Acinetobacter junii]